MGKQVSVAIKNMRALITQAAGVLPAATWPSAGELVAKGTAVLQAAETADLVATDEAFDGLIDQMQVLANFVGGLAKAGKEAVTAAETDRDKAKKANSKLKAIQAARDADGHRLFAAELYQWSQGVLALVQEAVKVIKSPTRAINAGIVVARIGVNDAEVAKQATRAVNAANAAQGIASTA